MAAVLGALGLAVAGLAGAHAKDYSAAGVPLTYLGPENEANLSTSYDSMQMSPSQTANLLDVLGPTLASSGLPDSRPILPVPMGEAPAAARDVAGAGASGLP
jgi:hypothetical protein